MSVKDCSQMVPRLHVDSDVQTAQVPLTWASWTMLSRGMSKSISCYNRRTDKNPKNRWTESIAQKVNLKRKKKVEDNSRKEIWRSVFEPQVLGVPNTSGVVSAEVLGSVILSSPLLQVKTLDHKPPMTQAEFDACVMPIYR